MMVMGGASRFLVVRLRGYRRYTENRGGQEREGIRDRGLLPVHFAMSPVSTTLESRRCLPKLLAEHSL